MKSLLVLAVLAGVARSSPGPEPEPAHAVALLPLDADAKLELYGQPVASELARALVLGGLDVVVVGPRMAVPEKARLVVDGTIKSGPGDSVTLSARIRDSRDGRVYDTLTATAASLTAIDKAEEELSGRVLPSVKSRLATLIAADNAMHAPRSAAPVARVAPIGPAPVGTQPAVAAMLVSIHADASAGASGDGLRAALATAIAPWATHRHHEIHVVETAPDAKAVAVQKAELAIAFDVLSIDLAQAEAAPISTARARVRVRIVDPQGTVFDRVIVTDTIVGEKGIGDKTSDQPALIARTAREVLSIADPQVRRRIPSWF